MDTQADALIAKAEQDIQAILLRLHNDEGIAIEHVNVDTRNYANYSVEIFQRKPKPAR